MDSLPSTATPFQPLSPGVQPAWEPQQAEDNDIDTPLLPTNDSAQTGQGLATQPSLLKNLWVDAQLPEMVRNNISIPADWQVVPVAENALQLRYGAENTLANWIFAVVAPFPSLTDGIALEDILLTWQGFPAGPFARLPLLMDYVTRAAFVGMWGEPAENTTMILDSAELLDYAWQNRPSWAIIPFEYLEPRWKVLTVDDISPIHKDFDAQAYPLIVPISLVGDPIAVEALTQVARENRIHLVPETNRNTDKMTVLVMTGVTALVRATAASMEQNGITYPATDIANWLREADITHISNEVSFATNCPFPNPVQRDMRFCSDPRYIELLEFIGTDIVELTGDHLADWGLAALTETLEMYRERGWQYFGGGDNLERAQQAITVEHHGNRLAFIGCNRKGGVFATASLTSPGAAACDLDMMEAEVQHSITEGYLPIVAFQHFEYYTYFAQPDQLQDFQHMALSGVVIISGSQAHQPQAMEFYNGAFIHYGLGNLFFDQYMLGYPMRQAFIDRHVFYDGKYISTELLTILFTDFSHTRPMTAGERTELLKAIFAASNW